MLTSNTFKISAFRKHRGRPPKPINAAKSELEREFQKDQNFDDNRQNELSRRLNISRNEVFQWYMTRCSGTYLCDNNVG